MVGVVMDVEKEGKWAGKREQTSDKESEVSQINSRGSAIKAGFTSVHT